MPPDIVTSADPSVDPLHNGSVPKAEAVISVGSLMVTATGKIHPFASVTVTVYTPAVRPVKSPLAWEPTPMS